MTKKETVFTPDLPNKKLTVTREFDAPLEQVWKAWTESGILDQWWAPKPYKAVTKRMDFREGGRWIYNMLGPTGDGTWCRVDYNIVVPQKRITTSVSFCDEAENINPDFPTMDWDKQFSATGSGSRVDILISFPSEADMQKIIGMGFQEGFTMGLGNLDEYLGTTSAVR